MKERIYRGTVRVVLLSIVIFSLILSFGLYFVFSDHFQAQLRSELDLLAAVAEDSHDIDGVFDRWIEAGEEARLTLIAPDGTVLNDTKADPDAMENHLTRPEVVSALENGSGISRRQSSTLDELTFYVARRLEDGSVLRLSGTQQSVFSVLLGAFLSVFLAVPLTLLASSIMADRTTKSILRPIDALNLDHPSDNEIYDEFTPLLSRLAVQNRRIESQMRELARRQNEFAAITENMSEGLLILNARAEILMMNRSARSIFRLGREDYTGQYVLALHRSPELMSVVQSAEEGKASDELMRMGGKVFQLIASPVEEGGTITGILLLIPDVTERVEAERTRREFSANVSHELKTPLTSILGYAELMQSGLVPQEDMRKFSGQIYDAARRLLKLVEDIIHLSRLDENSAPVEVGEVDLAELVDGVCERLQLQADAAHVELHRELHPAILQGASQLLDELTANLVENAIKYNRPGGDVTVEVCPLPEGARLTVRDTGIGIAPEHHEKIFERFYRVDKSHSREIGGTGLGLSIVKHVAAFHHAQIKMESEPGVGTSICVEFPATFESVPVRERG